MAHGMSGALLIVILTVGLLALYQWTKRRNAERLLRHLPAPVLVEIDASSGKDYRELLENASDLIYSIDLQGNFLSINRAAEQISGYGRDEALRMNIADVTAPEYLDLARQNIQRTLRGEAPVPYQLEIIAKDSRRVVLEVSHRLVLKNGIPTGTHAIARDITERRYAEHLERDRLRVLEMIVSPKPLEEILSELVLLLERHNPEIRFSISLSREASQLSQAHLAESIPIASSSGDVLGTLSMYGRKPLRVDRTHLKLLDMGSRLAAIAIEQRQLTEQLAYQAQYDVLTGLPNRVLFQKRLEKAIDDASRFERSMALLYIDLDRFKLINDTLGHAMGDMLLSQVAERLNTCVRRTDSLARICGDEFTVIITALNHPQDVEVVAAKILQSLRLPFTLEGNELMVTTSIGISIYPEDAQDAETLQRNADSAMYRAKKRGKNRFQYFAPELGAKVMPFPPQISAASNVLSTHSIDI